MLRFPPRRVERFQGCNVLKLEFWHMAVWTSVGIYGHLWLLRSCFLLASRAAFFFVLAVSLFVFCSVQG